MTKDEALKMAIDGLEIHQKDILDACKEALEQPTNMVTIPLDKLEDMQRRLKPKEWQGLSDDEIVTKWIEHFVGNTFKGIEFARAVEDKLKEKNNV